MSIDQIDTDLPLKPQLDDTKDKAEEIWKVLRGQVDEKIGDMLDEKT